MYHTNVGTRVKEVQKLGQNVVPRNILERKNLMYKEKQL
jgi:hypothetical protein